MEKYMIINRFLNTLMI